jgi:hypothetical protein
MYFVSSVLMILCCCLWHVPDITDYLDQAWPNSGTGGQHNSLRTRLKAARVYTYILRRGGGGEGLSEINGHYLQITSYAKSAVE